MNIIIALIVGGIAGWLAGLIRKGHGFGWITNIVLGIFGGFVGSFLLGFLGIEDTNFVGSILVSTLGAVVILAIANLFKQN